MCSMESFKYVTDRGWFSAKKQSFYGICQDCITGRLYSTFLLHPKSKIPLRQWFLRLKIPLRQWFLRLWPSEGRGWGWGCNECNRIAPQFINCISKAVGTLICMCKPNRRLIWWGSSPLPHPPPPPPPQKKLRMGLDVTWNNELLQTNVCINFYIIFPQKIGSAQKNVKHNYLHQNVSRHSTRDVGNISAPFYCLALYRLSLNLSARDSLHSVNKE